jgi:hypothetical protein
MLPSKTIPETRKGHTLKPRTKAKLTAPPAKKARPSSVEVEDVEDEDSPRSTTTRNATISPANSFEIPNAAKVGYCSIILGSVY